MGDETPRASAIVFPRRSQEFDHAAEYFLGALKDEPELFKKAGMVYLSQKHQMEIAQVYFQQAFALDPNQPDLVALLQGKGGAKGANAPEEPAFPTPPGDGYPRHRHDGEEFGPGAGAAVAELAGAAVVGSTMLGSENGGLAAAGHYTLIQTAKLHGLAPYACLRGALLQLATNPTQPPENSSPPPRKRQAKAERGTCPRPKLLMPKPWCPPDAYPKTKEVKREKMTCLRKHAQRGECLPIAITVQPW